MDNKNQEITRHFAEIWRELSDPQMREKRKLKEKREKKIKDIAEDLGIKYGK